MNGAPNAQTIALTLNDVTDTFGRTLPPTTIRMSVLRGDSNGDGFVNGVMPCKPATIPVSRPTGPTSVLM